MLRYGEVNPLAVFGLRRLDHCPPHFQRVEFEARVSDKDIADWIYTNLDGRFYLGDYYVSKSDGAVSMVKCAAFEMAGESSYFAIQLDKINSHQNELV